MGTRTPLREELLTHDVDVSWWVTPHAYEHGYYTMVYAALQHWIKTAFPFTSAYYSNTEIPANPALLRRQERVRSPASREPE